MSMPESDWTRFVQRLSEKKGAAVAGVTRRLLESVVALTTDESRIVTPPTSGSSRLQQDVCVDVEGHVRARLFRINDEGVLTFFFSSANAEALVTYRAFQASELEELERRLLAIDGAEWGEDRTRITIKDVTLLDDHGIEQFIGTIGWMMTVVHRAAS